MSVADLEKDRPSVFASHFRPNSRETKASKLESKNATMVYRTKLHLFKYETDTAKLVYALSGRMSTLLVENSSGTELKRWPQFEKGK